jgi:sulfite reductase (NADPH) hemoprotein beta-component
MSENTPLSEVEGIKTRSRSLRGTIQESLADEMTGALAPDDQQVIKFHGSYQQQDRSIELERKKKKLEPLYSFMIRVRVPGGVVTPAQWLALDGLTEEYGIGTLKLTTRQAVELHGVFKRNLKKTLKGINACLLDSLAGCGDVNRNVMASALPNLTRAHVEMHAVVKAVHEHLTPKTKAYHELWLNDTLMGGGAQEDPEPIYGKTYLPRKFKIAFAIPPVNDTDIFANDLGFIAIVEKGVLVGFNVAIGGGMGCTFGMPETFPRLGNIIGFVPKDKVVDLCEKVVLLQRDNGNRSNRKLSRFKYTVEKLTVAGVQSDLEKRCGFALEPARTAVFTTNNDKYGWQKGEDGKWHMTLFVEGGRVKDTAAYPLRTGLREIARVHRGVYILTGNQNLVLANISEADKPLLENLLEKYGVTGQQKITAARGQRFGVCGFAFVFVGFCRCGTVHACVYGSAG